MQGNEPKSHWILSYYTNLHTHNLHYNKTPAKAFTPPAKTKMITRPGRAVTRAFIGGVVYSLISILPKGTFQGILRHC